MAKIKLTDTWQVNLCPCVKWRSNFKKWENFIPISRKYPNMITKMLHEGWVEHPYRYSYEHRKERTGFHRTNMVNGTWTAACISEVLSLASHIAATASVTNLLRLTLRTSSIKLSRCSSLICLSFLITAVLRLMLESSVLKKEGSESNNFNYLRVRNK